MLYWCALLLAVFFNIAANTALKKSMIESNSTEGIYGLFGYLLTSSFFWMGLISAGLLLACYLFALRGVQLGIAYATVTGLAMVGVLFAGVLLFEESLSVLKVIGAVLVISGVFVLSQAG